MAKDNLFLGTARGAVGDVVFSRSNGHQVSRVRNRAPRNPQSAIQMMQRVVLKTGMSAYSMFREIADHAFQGAKNKTDNQSEFVKRNVNEMRKELQQLIDLNDPEEIMTAQDTNFAAKQMALPVLRPYVMSSGSLQGVTINAGAGGFKIPEFANLDWDSNPQGESICTYADVVAALGLQKGDQLTFLFGYIDDTDDTAEINDFRFARVILSPDDGDMTKRMFVKGESTTPYTIANANSRNQGSVYFSILGDIIGQTDAGEYTAGAARTLALCGVIVSRLNGGVWQRSTCQLTMRENGAGVTGSLQWDHKTAALGSAIWSYMNESNSSLYLNQAQG